MSTDFSQTWQQLCCCSLNDSQTEGASTVYLDQHPAIGEALVHGQAMHLKDAQNAGVKLPHGFVESVPSIPLSKFSPIVAGPRSNASGQMHEFSILIEKGGVQSPGLGLDVDVTDGPALLIDAVQDGLVKIWNEANPQLQVMSHDRFIDVNGVRGDCREIVEELSSAESLSIVVRRPVEFAVSVRKPNDEAKLGLELSYCAGGATLLVMAVREGLIDSWNREHPDRAVLKGTRVLEVNGITGNSRELFDTLIQSDALQLRCMKGVSS